ncbi:MAG: malic enzyme-like NAD(P)-binding protein [Ilumatobacteraceae bacterium]
MPALQPRRRAGRRGTRPPHPPRRPGGLIPTLSRWGRAWREFNAGELPALRSPRVLRGADVGPSPSSAPCSSAPSTDFAALIEDLRPTAIIGVSTVGKAFDRNVVEAMAQRP